MKFSVGSLVSVREREWIVMPESQDDLLVLRPLDGSDEETTGIYLPLEKVEFATFGSPSSDHFGDFNSGKLLRDAIRLGFRSSAGPFRSIAKIAVEPRPYQFVPLLLALRQDPHLFDFPNFSEHRITPALTNFNISTTSLLFTSNVS